MSDDKPRRQPYIQGDNTRADVSREARIATHRARTNAGAPVDMSAPPDFPDLDFGENTRPTAVPLEPGRAPLNVQAILAENWRLTKQVEHRQRRESEALTKAREQQTNHISELLQRLQKAEHDLAAIGGDAKELVTLRAAIVALEKFQTDTVGINGSNGKIGRLTDRLAETEKDTAKNCEAIEAINKQFLMTRKDWAVVGAKLASLALAGAGIVAGYVRLEARSEQNSRMSERNQTRIEQMRERHFYDPPPTPTKP